MAATLTVKILADLTDYGKNLDKSERMLLKSVDRLEGIGKKLSLAFTLPYVAASAALSKAAADDEASVAKLERTFGTSAKAMDQWIGNLMKTVPATDDEIRGLAVSTDTLLRSMNLSAPAAQELTKNVTQLAGDLAAYKHVELGVAQDALEKALAGKTRGLAEFDIVISEAEVKTRAYQMGLARVGQELTHAQTAQAAWALILDRSKLQQGEAARTIGDNANALARFKQAADGAGDALGAVFLPAVASVVNGGTKLLNVIAGLPTPLKVAGVGIGGIAALAGPSIIAIGNLTDSVLTLKGALKGLGEGSVLAGLRSIGTLGAAAAIVLAPIAAVSYAFNKEGEAARTAAADLDRYSAAVGNLSLDQAKLQLTASQGVLQSLEQRRRDIAARLNGIKPGTPGYDVSTSPQQIAALSRELNNVVAAQTKVRAEFDVIVARVHELGAVSTGHGGSVATLDEQLKDLAARASAVATSIAQVRDGWNIAGVNTAWFTTLSEASSLLDRVPDKLSPVAVQLRQIVDDLKRAMVADPAALLSRLGSAASLPVQMTPTGFGNVRLSSFGLLGDPSTDPNRTPGNWLFELPPKIDRVSKSLDAGFAQVSVAIGDTLATNLANWLGGRGRGAQIGGAIGGAAGDAVLKELFSGVGGVVGQAVFPVVGGIVGTALGGAIGGLFGHHTQAVVENTKAVEKLTESILNAPTGFKVERPRFMASVGRDLYNTLGAIAESEAARGGTSSWELAPGAI